MRRLIAQAAIVVGAFVAAVLASDFRARARAQEPGVAGLRESFLQADLQLILLEPACPRTMVCLDHQAALYLIDAPLPAIAAVTAALCALFVCLIGRRLLMKR